LVRHETPHIVFCCDSLTKHLIKCLYFDEVSNWLTMPDQSRSSKQAIENAQSLALQVLAFLAGDEDALNAFLLTTGVDLGYLRDNAHDIQFQAGVLDYLLGNEPLLLAFSERAGLRPEKVAAMRHHLPGAIDAA
jgi:Protein of unknown function (DUF3572)